MKLTDLWKVKELAANLDAVKWHKFQVENGKFGIAIDGTWQDEEFKKACKETMLAVLAKREEKIVDELQSFGIELE